MNNKEISEALARLQACSASLEEAYEETGGEITEETLRMEQEREALRELLTTEGVDALGRWLKGKEDEAKTIKAEADYINNRCKAVKNSIEYVKGRIVEVLTSCGIDKIKGGNGYSFTAYDSVTTSVDKDTIKERWQTIAEQALRSAGVPAWITVKLDANVSAVPEGEDLPDVFTQEVKTAVRFLKPRASKD